MAAPLGAFKLFFILSVHIQCIPGRARFGDSAGRGWELVPAPGPRPYELGLGQRARPAGRPVAHGSLSKVSSGTEPKAQRLNIALRRTAAPTGSTTLCNCEGFWRVHEYRVQAPAVRECRVRSRTPAERRFQRVPLQSARAGERPLLQTSGGCNYGMTSRIFSRCTRCLLWPSCV